jgi:thioredoxin reductase (NADPH)
VVGLPRRRAGHGGRQGGADQRVGLHRPRCLLRGLPFDAIKLVFGTEKRGIDIPHVTPQFETNVPGIFIAGELGGMGLIRKAAEQGARPWTASAAAAWDADLDVVIVGCGPAGLSAGLSAMQHKLRYR